MSIDAIPPFAVNAHLLCPHHDPSLLHLVFPSLPLANPYVCLIQRPQFTWKEIRTCISRTSDAVQLLEHGLLLCGKASKESVKLRDHALVRLDDLFGG